MWLFIIHFYVPSNSLPHVNSTHRNESALFFLTVRLLDFFLFFSTEFVCCIAKTKVDFDKTEINLHKNDLLFIPVLFYSQFTLRVFCMNDWLFRWLIFKVTNKVIRLEDEVFEIESDFNTMNEWTPLWKQNSVYTANEYNDVSILIDFTFALPIYGENNLRLNWLYQHS